MSTQTMLVYAMAGFALLHGGFFLKLAISASSRPAPDDGLKHGGDASNQSRIERADDSRERVSPQARYAASVLGFVMAGALLAHLVTPAVAYAVLCLSMAARCVADQLVEERTPRRRSAVIGRSRSIDPVLAMWIALTGAATLALVPWLLEQPYRVAAAIVASCAAIMVLLAWRIASAPPVLFGNDVEAEQVVDRETRALRTGNACFLTVCAVTAFVAFIAGQNDFADHRFTVFGLEILCVGLLAWRSFYARRLTRTPLAS